MVTTVYVVMVVVRDDQTLVCFLQSGVPLNKNLDFLVRLFPSSASKVVAVSFFVLILFRLTKCTRFIFSVFL